MAEDLIRKSGLSFTILRSVSVYGPHDKEILTYVKLLNSGICPIVGFGEKYLNLIHVQDLVDLIMKIVKNDHFMNHIYFATDGQFYSVHSLMENIANALQKKSIRIRVPTFLAMFIGLLNDVFVSPDKKLVTRDKIRELACQYWMCSNERVVKTLEFKPKYTFERGIVETIKWYKEQGVLS
jgi:nucleoside-diphosphate-sugar epimerase